MIRTRRAKQAVMISGINVTPLTDVSLVLLIIFMVTATAMTSERHLKLILPKTASEAPLPESLTLRIDAEQQMYLNEQPVAPADLAAQVRAYHEQTGARLLVVKADTRVPYGIVYEAIDAARGVGMHSIGLAGRRAEIPITNEQP